jgi:hypothetical protein
MGGLLNESLLLLDESVSFGIWGKTVFKILYVRDVNAKTYVFVSYISLHMS